MRSKINLVCAAALLLTAACGDGDNKPESPADGGAPTGSRVPDAGREAARDAARDATLTIDATTVAKPDASDRVEQDAAQALDADLDATPDVAAIEDAAVDTTDAVVIIEEPDAAMGEPDADVVDVPDAEPPPPPVCDPSVAPVVGKLGLQTIVTGQNLAYLTEAHQPPNSNDWYLVQQDGYIKILRDGTVLPEPFLDLSTEITLSNDAVYEDRGLVSIEFAPDYASSGRFYVSITANLGQRSNLDEVRVYARSAANPDKADPDAKGYILSLEGAHRYAFSDYTTNIHNGGRITFGPDGMLYLAMGDGGGIRCGDSEPGATQDVNTLFGKILRFDLSQPPPYYAALDNPFVTGGDPRVLHYGLRNPFRFSFDRSTGDLYLGDVGQNSYEEVDFAPAGSKGLNFGWAHYEGNSEDDCGALHALRPGSVYAPPIVSIDRRPGAPGPFGDYNAMIGGVVYRGAALPQLNGIYFFGGFKGLRLGALRQCGSTTSPVTPVTKQCNANFPGEACLTPAPGARQFTELRAIVEDHEGEMYFVANRNSLFKVVPL